MKRIFSVIIIAQLTSCIVETPKLELSYLFVNDTDLDLDLTRYESKNGIDKDIRHIYRHKIKKKESLAPNNYRKNNLDIDSIKIVFEDGKIQMFKRSDRELNPKRWNKSPLNISNFRQTDNIEIYQYTIDNSIYKLSN